MSKTIEAYDDALRVYFEDRGPLADEPAHYSERNERDSGWFFVSRYRPLAFVTDAGEVLDPDEACEEGHLTEEELAEHD
jgi:hypothetical protein